MSDIYSQLGASPPAAQLPEPPPTIASPAELRSYDPTLSQRIKGSLQDLMMGAGANAQVSEHLAGGLTGLAQFIPPIGMATAASDMQREARSGNMLGTLISAVGAVPGIGPEAKVAGKAAQAASHDLPSLQKMVDEIAKEHGVVAPQIKHDPNFKELGMYNTSSKEITVSELKKDTVLEEMAHHLDYETGSIHGGNPPEPGAFRAYSETEQHGPSYKAHYEKLNNKHNLPEIPKAMYRGTASGIDATGAIRPTAIGDLGSGVYLSPSKEIASSYGGGPEASVKNGTRVVHSFGFNRELKPDEVAHVFEGAKVNEDVRIVRGDGTQLYKGPWGAKQMEAALKQHPNIKAVIGDKKSIGVNQVAVRDPSILAVTK